MPSCRSGHSEQRGVYSTGSSRLYSLTAQWLHPSAHEQANVSWTDTHVHIYIYTCMCSCIEVCCDSALWGGCHKSMSLCFAVPSPTLLPLLPCHMTHRWTPGSSHPSQVGVDQSQSMLATWGQTSSPNLDCRFVYCMYTVSVLHILYCMVDVHIHEYPHTNTQLLHVGLKRGKFDSSSEEQLGMLDPFVPLLAKSLSSRHIKVLSRALQCLVWIVRMPLPSLGSHINEISTHLFGLLRRYARAGTAVGSNRELVHSSFKVCPYAGTTNSDDVSMMLSGNDGDLEGLQKARCVRGWTHCLAQLCWRRHPWPSTPEHSLPFA